MPGPLDELQRLLGGQGGFQPQSRPAAPGGGLLDLTPDEWAAFMRRLPMSDAPGAAPAQPFLGEWPLEVQGDWVKNRTRWNEPFQGRMMYRHQVPF